MNQWKKLGGQASPDSCSIMTVIDLDTWSQSSRAQEVIEGAPAWKSTFKPKSTASSPEDLHFEAQCCKPESQGFRDRQKQAQGCVTACSFKMAPPICFSDCYSDVFIAPNILVSQDSLSGFQPLSCGDSSNSQKLNDLERREQPRPAGDPETTAQI
ncbi:hypothetical protein Celaphus_00016982 [Cervus elaphus hippelaphus]|uniref:Uncharacterized protein n=1 Tax=Cervus elaphus hippelaphus TaxID=46360 RepID=A0A212CME6_CEREH|nr:hypothetical protein Celaphus_00016982 [Cervus elaphus hippelaphus]